MIFRKCEKTPPSSGGRNFTNFWSLRILKYIGHVYSSRALHFWHWFLGPPTLNPSNPTKRNHKNRNFRFWLALGRKSLKILENHEISWFSKNTIDFRRPQLYEFSKLQNFKMYRTRLIIGSSSFFENFQVKTSQNRKFCFFWRGRGYDWSGLRGSEWKRERN